MINKPLGNINVVKKCESR